jgi:hypothetical protein
MTDLLSSNLACPVGHGQPQNIRKSSKLAYKHKMVKKTWAESARWILHQDVRDATWTCHTWRLEGLASENVILEQVVWLLKKLPRSAQHNRLLLSSHRQGLFCFEHLWSAFAFEPLQFFNEEPATNSKNFDQRHEQRACSPTVPWALGAPWRCHTYSICRARDQTTKLPPLHRAEGWRAMVSSCKPEI